MKLKTLASLITLSLATTLITGCDFEGSSNPDSETDSNVDSGTDTGTDNSTNTTSPLTGEYWQFANDSDSDLPNVYTFNDTKQYYYDDDEISNKYDVEESIFNEDAEEGTVSFTYYNPEAIDITGTYTVSGDTLTIDAGNNGILTATNISNDQAMLDAVEEANDESDIEIGITYDFDNYTVGTNISDANSKWEEENTQGKNEEYFSQAIISSEQAKSGKNSLHLSDLDSDKKPFVIRKFDSEDVSSGSVSLDIFIPNTNINPVYVGIGDDKNTKNRYFELKLTSSGNMQTTMRELVEGEQQPVPEVLTTFPLNTWFSLSFNWDASTINISVDDSQLDPITHSETYFSQYDTTPTQLNLYVGKDDDTSDHVYFDNVNSDLFN